MARCLSVCLSQAAIIHLMAASVFFLLYQCIGLAIYRSQVQFPAGRLSRNIGQLSLASLRGLQIEYLLRLGVKAGFSPLPGGR